MKSNKNLGQCPHCGSKELEYGTLQLVDNQVYYPIDCVNCKGTFKEWHNLVFSENTFTSTKKNVIVFENIKVNKFNRLYGSNLNSTMTFHEVSDQIDKSDVSEFFIGMSMKKEDVVDLLLESDKLEKISFLYIEEVGIYIAFYE